jgi:uncharacterized membrane protein YfhO
VRFYDDAEVIPGEKILTAMKSIGFDPSITLYLDSSDLEIDRSPVSADGVHEFSSEFVNYSSNRLRVNMSVPHSGYALFSELYYPGWIAIADNEIVEILRGNHCFRTVRVDESVSGLEMLYFPMQFKLGLYISMMTISCIIFARLK